MQMLKEIENPLESKYGLKGSNSVTAIKNCMFQNNQNNYLGILFSQLGLKSSRCKMKK